MTDVKEISYGFGVKVAVLMFGIVQYTMTMTTQIAANIQSYSQQTLGEQFGYLYNQTDAIVYGLAAVSGLGTTFLFKYFSKKQVGIAGALLMGIFGFLPFFTGQMGYLGVLVPRALVGLGVGICMPFAASYAVDLFKGGKESWMLGMRSVVGACAGFAFMNQSAFIANLYYATPAGAPPLFPAGAFWLPLIAIIAAIIMIVRLPNEGVQYAAAEEKKSVKPDNAKFIYLTIGVLAAGVALAFCYFVYQAVTNIVSAPDEGIAYVMSVAIAIIFLIFAVVFIVMMLKVSANKNPVEGVATKIKSNTWVFILANVLIVGTCNIMMANVAQVVGGPVISGAADWAPGVALPPEVGTFLATQSVYMGPDPALAGAVINTVSPWAMTEAGPVPTVNIGNIMNSFTIAMLLSGFIFKPVWVNFFKRHVYTAGIFMCGLGLTLLYVSVAIMGNFPFAIVAAFIFGLGFQVYNGAVILRIAQSTDNKHIALGTSYMMAFNGLGQTFGPVWIPGLVMLITGAAFSDFFIFSRCWLAGGIILLVMAVIGGIFTQREKVYRPEAAF
ncbi:MAG: hypothetical protein LBO07_03035 [Coriobacteriales bacterium]|jgi:MFS family permease|nr:hypothetical protein [Coriobacteriales bacterium]